MIRVGIVGGTGYTGVELLRLLAVHPKVEVVCITSRSEAGVAVADWFPSLRGHYDLAFTVPDIGTLSQCDLVFFATPHGVAQSMMSELMSAGTRVVDLSADFRIKDAQLWSDWYKQQHACPELLENAVYGLPEVNRDVIRSAQLVACPGCYPTATQLGFIPLIENGLVKPTSLIANVASGVSGAGRGASVNALFSEVADSVKAYAASGHRHLPEIEQGLRECQSQGRTQDEQQVELTFVPHLLPMIRGIHASLYAELNDPSLSEALVHQVFVERYANEPFVDVLPLGDLPQTRSVKTTNVCRIAIVKPQGRDKIAVFAVIDNLTKGASGQAVQNMNIMFGWDETLGLNAPAILP